MEQKEIIYSGKRISYSVHGNGVPVLLIHGFGEDSSVWKNQVDALQNYQLIIPDLPGSGNSEVIDDMSIDGMAAVLEKIILNEAPGSTKEGVVQKLSLSANIANNKYESNVSKVGAQVAFPTGEGRDGAVMVGHSMGGYITLAFAEKHSSLLRGIGLFHSTAFADTEEKKLTRQKGIEFIQQHGSFEFLKTTIPNLYSDNSRKKYPELIEEHIASAHNFSGDALVHYYEAMIERPDRTPVLKSTDLPVLLLFGKYDTAVALEDGLKQAHLPQTSYIHILDKSGHMGMLEEPESTNKHLLNYLNFLTNYI